MVLFFLSNWIPQNLIPKGKENIPHISILLLSWTSYGSHLDRTTANCQIDIVTFSRGFRHHSAVKENGHKRSNCCFHLRQLTSSHIQIVTTGSCQINVNLSWRFRFKEKGQDNYFISFHLLVTEMYQVTKDKFSLMFLRGISNYSWFRVFNCFHGVITHQPVLV